MIFKWFKNSVPRQLSTWESAWKKLGYFAVSVPRIYTLSPGSKESTLLESELERCERLLLQAETPRDLDRAGVVLQDVTERHAKAQQQQVDTLIDGLSNSIRLLVSQISDTAEKNESSLDDLATVESRLRQATEAPSLDQTKVLLSDAIRSVGRVVERQVQVFENLRERSEAAKNFLTQELERAEEQGRTDALTRIGNRVSFDFYSAGIQSKVQSGEGPYSVATFDLDGFKQINDEFGHAVGDEALLSFAERLRQALGERAFLARFGGDEFVAIAALEEETLAGRCRRLSESMDKRPTSLVSQGKAFVVSLGASFGVSLLETNRTLSESMSLADQKMYAHKRLRKEKPKAA